MFKTIWFARFRSDMEKAEARRYWAEEHAEICIATDIGGYAQNHVVGPLPYVSGVAEEQTFFDSYSVGWWRDRSAYDATVARDDWQALVADGDNMLDMPRLAGLTAAIREHIVIDGPTSPYKVVWVVRFKEGLDPVAAHTYWEDVHGPLFPRDSIDRYVQNHVVGPVVDLPTFDGFSECWFKSEASFLSAIATDAWAVAVRDSEKLFDTSQVWGAVLEERMIKPPRVGPDA